MDINSLRQLSQDDAFTVAADYAGVTPDVLKNMWRRESGNGTNLGPSEAGAVGHFQQLPATLHTIEKRTGTKLNPSNFTDSLFAASQVLRENMDKFQDVGDSVRAYHGGWDRKQWGPKTAAYVADLLGPTTPPATAVVQTSAPQAVAAREGGGFGDNRDMFRQLDSGVAGSTGLVPGVAVAPQKLTPQEKVAVTAAGGQVAAAGGDTLAVMQAMAGRKETVVGDPSLAGPEQPVGRSEASDKIIREQVKEYDQYVQTGERRDRWNFLDRTFAAVHRNSVSQAAADAFLRENFPLDPTWKPEAQLEEWKKQYSPDELDWLMDTRSEAHAKSVMDQISDRHRDEDIYTQGGTQWALAENILAGTVGDPVSMVALAGLGKVAQLSSMALKLGRGGKMALAMGEGAVGNVAVTATLDALGDYKSTNDYLTAAAMGAALVPVFAGVGKGAGLAVKGVSYLARGMARESGVANQAIVARAAELADRGYQPDDIKAALSSEEAARAAAAHRILLADVAEQDKLFAATPEEVTARVERTTQAAKDKLEVLTRHVDEATTALEAAVKDDAAVVSKSEVLQIKNTPLTPEELPRGMQGAAKFIGSIKPEEGPQLAEHVDRLFTNSSAGLQPGEAYNFTNTALDGLAKADVRRGLAAVGVRTTEDLKALLRGENTGLSGKLHGDFTVREGLRDIVARADDPALTRIAAHLESLLPDDLPVLAGTANARNTGSWNGLFDPKMGSIHMRQESPDVLRQLLRDGDKATTTTYVHEVVHAATSAAILQAERNPKVSPRIKAGYDQLNSIRQAVAGLLKDGVIKDDLGQIAYAIKDVHEFASVGLSHAPTIQILRSQKWESTNQTLMSKFVSGMRKLLKIKKDDYTMFDGLMQGFEQIADQRYEVQTSLGDFGDVRFQLGQDVPPTEPLAPKAAAKLEKLKAALAKQQAKIAAAEDTTQDEFSAVGNPMDRAFMRDIKDRARQFVEANPIDMEKTRSVLTTLNKVSPDLANALESTGIKLLRSENPIAKWFGTMVAESTTGAAGRKRTAAIQKFMLENQYREMQYYGDREFAHWAQAQGTGFAKQVWNPDHYEKFNRLVHDENTRRGTSDYIPSTDPAIVRAADAYEKLYDRLRQDQITSKTPGYAALPGTSVGYVPRHLSAQKVGLGSVESLRALENEFAMQFKDELGFDPEFSSQLAKSYIDHARKRAYGETEMPAHVSEPSFDAKLYDLLMEMGMNSDEAAAQISRYRKGAAAHTKTRLNIDITKSIKDPVSGVEFNMTDFYDTNMATLANRYARRVSGDVAFAQLGIPGEYGVKLMTRAMQYGNDRVTMEEMAAVNQIVAEMYGRPFGKGGNNKNLANLRLLTGMASLGGNAFQQSGETLNIVSHLGVAAVMKHILGLAQMSAEVRKLKTSGVLDSIELIGGKQDADVRFVFPFEEPNEPQVYGSQDLNAFDRLVRSAAKSFPKYNLSRAVRKWQLDLAVQQTVAKTARYIRDGKELTSLVTDMGFTPELISKFAKEIPNIARWDNEDHLVSFDITKAQDADVANAYIQGVVRGAGQMIQSKFVGESGKYIHGDLLRTLSQFRTFSILSAEKQWRRASTNLGMATAGSFLLMQAAAALPLHFARIKLQALGMDESKREEFIDKRMSPLALAQALLNYTSLSGIAGEPLNVMAGVLAVGADSRSGGFLDPLRDAAGVSRKGFDPLSAVPALGFVARGGAAIGRAVADPSLETLTKAGASVLPGGNLPYLIPFLNKAYSQD